MYHHVVTVCKRACVRSENGNNARGHRQRTGTSRRSASQQTAPFLIYRFTGVYTLLINDPVPAGAVGGVGCGRNGPTSGGKSVVIRCVVVVTRHLQESWGVGMSQGGNGQECTYVNGWRKKSKRVASGVRLPYGGVCGAVGPTSLCVVKNANKNVQTIIPFHYHPI